MKVLQINSFFSVGGPPRIVNGIYDTLKEQGHECKIAAAREKMYAPEDSIRIGSDLGVKINALASRLFDNVGFSAKTATKKLIKQIEEYDPDIIHLHNLHGYYINIEILFNYLKKANKKVFWTLHDCWAFTGHCAHFTLADCYKWKTCCENCPQKRSYPSSLLLSRAKRNFGRKKAAFTGVKDMTIITPSKWLAELVGQSFLGSYPISVINNGIDVNLFKHKESDILIKNNIENKKIVLGVAQNWAEQKGLEDFIALSTLLPSNYQVVMIGLTSEQSKTMPRSVLALERTNNIDELVCWYSAANIFVNTTYQDTFPTVNLEAQACSTPVITYNTGGSSESVPSENVVSQGDINALVSKIKELCESPNSEAKIFSTENYDRKILYREYIKLYSK